MGAWRCNGHILCVGSVCQRPLYGIGDEHAHNHGQVQPESHMLCLCACRRVCTPVQCTSCIYGRTVCQHSFCVVAAFYPVAFIFLVNLPERTSRFGAGLRSLSFRVVVQHYAGLEKRSTGCMCEPWSAMSVSPIPRHRLSYNRLFLGAWPMGLADMPMG